jgi:glycine/D-amino acid oxidase-like deaminating enzyme
VIVGMGVLGASLAQRLARRGWDVSMVDQYQPGHARAASGTNTRIIRYSHGAAVADTRSAWEARALWREIETQTGTELMHKTGMTWFAKISDDSWEAESQRVLTEEGIPFERIEPEDATRLFPDLGTADIKYLLYEPEACVLQSRLAVRTMAADAVANGARFVGGTARPRDGAAEVNGQRLTADRIVWATGAWAPGVFPDLIHGTVIQQDLFYFGVALAWRTPGVPAWGQDAGGMTGLGDLHGRGFKLGADCPGPRWDPDTGERTPDPNQLTLVRDYLARRFPAIARAPLLGTETCQTTILDAPIADGVPVQAGAQMLRHPDHASNWILGDGSGSVFKHGPAIARRMEELIA